MNRERSHGALIVYLYGLLSFVVVVAATVVGVTFVQYQWQARASDDIEQFHVRTLTVASEISSRLGTAREIVRTADPSTDVEAERRLTSSVLSIAKGIDEIAELQREQGEPAFDAITARLEASADVMREATTTRSWTAERWSDELAALDLAAFQLNRLHSITLEGELREIAQRDELIRLAMMVGVPVILVGTTLVVVRLLRVVRLRLHELDDTHAELLRTRARLEQKQKLEALGTLIGGVAHDFNNLLTAILGNAEVELRRFPPEDPTHESLTTIQRAGQQAAGLTRQLLAFGRVEDRNPVPTDLDQLVRSVEPVLRGLVPDEVEFEVSARAVGTVLVDPVQMEQVVLNLVVNARDATPSGGRISVRTDRVTLDDAGTEDDHGRTGAYGRIRVEDTGSGISESVQQRIFEPFFTTKEQGQGTGLGLSMVHGIVTRSAGFIEVDSEPGRGTRFDVYLPLVDVPAPEASPAPTSAGDQRTETILVVEDEEQIRELLEQGLSHAGYRVVAAANGEQAFEAYEAEDGRVDLVLTDVQMSGLRGPDLVSGLRSWDPDLVAVYISGFSTAADLEAIRAAGDEYVSKPFSFADLEAAITRRLAHRAVTPDESTPDNGRVVRSS